MFVLIYGLFGNSNNFSELVKIFVYCYMVYIVDCLGSGFLSCYKSIFVSFE